MKYNELLLSKNGLATLYLSREFLKCDINSKIKTVTELSEELGLARGTVQNAIKLLIENHAIKLVSRGHLGTYLANKDVKELLNFAGISSIVGVMPLPYSLKYEGLATGLIATLENQYNIPVSLAYMRGAKSRIGMLLASRYDFAVVSKFAANNFMKDNDQIIIIKEFGPYSYLNAHVLVFKDKNKSKIEDNMRVALDITSIDQQKLTEKMCDGLDVEYVYIDYSQVLKRIEDDEIDVAIWNIDEINEKKSDVHYVQLEIDNADDTIACIVCNKNNEEIASLLNSIIDISVVKDTQRLVIENRITPSY